MIFNIVINNATAGLSVVFRHSRKIDRIQNAKCPENFVNLPFFQVRCPFVRLSDVLRPLRFATVRFVPPGSQMRRYLDDEVTHNNVHE